jgi:hypothetical protein
MSSQHSPFAQRFASVLEKMNRSGSNAYAYEVNDTDRILALLDAATGTFDVNDPSAVEGVFAIQGISRKHASGAQGPGAMPRDVQIAQRFQEPAASRLIPRPNKKFERPDC